MAPEFTQDNIFIFHITLESDKSELVHTTQAQILFGDGMELPAACHPDNKAAVIY